MNKKILKGLSVFFILLSIVLVFTGCDNQGAIETSSESEPLKEQATTQVVGDLKVHFIDVGQADSILIQNEDHNMLIDAGNNGDGDLVVNYLKKQGIEKLDYVVGTHPHEDHIGGLDDVIDNFHIEKVYMPKVTHTSKTFKDVMTSIKNKGLKISTPHVGEEIILGDAKGMILAPNNLEYKDYNNYSIVIKLVYGNTSFLFTGDAESISEAEMLKNGLDLSSDVLKVGHHGSHSSTTIPFLDQVNPKYAVIMCETGNDYGHPHKETMEKLEQRNISIYRTDQQGTIIASSNGQEINFNISSTNDAYKKDTNINDKKEISKEQSTESTEGLIKGNINSKGEKIYHMPDGVYYAKVNAEVYFKTEEEAQKAGFRKSKR
ncbi:ComEC/Rec2 family competence protein [Inediibacterium massiliense]|uniref:ComEC/Rec2 family competence protein n=1 Tax=Inediibacterium massiliense TaxID=1658111 RepID=UPI0006B44160|nr:MBL fold metallo-hydrolase [Inediibacterium massiliense]